MSRSDRSFYRVSRGWAADLMGHLALSQKSRFNFLAILIGCLSGLSAVAFHKSIYWAEENWIYRVSQIPGWMGVLTLIALPTAGGLVVGFLVKYWAPEAAGSGIPQVKAAYFLKFGRIRFRAAMGKFVLGTISIGSGASLGREGPTVHISAAIASWVGRWFGLAPRQIMALIPLGCAGGIAAAFNTPLAAIVFAIEEIMGDLKHKAFAGIVMVAVIAAVIERSMLGTDSMFQVPLHPDHLSWLSLGMSVLLGVLAGFVSHAFVEGILRTRERVKLVRGPYNWMMPGVGGLLTGCIGAVIFKNLGHMGVFGIGYLDLSDALAGSLGLGTLLALFVGKFAATIFSYSSGGSGGIFAPVLFIGAMLGGALGVFAEMIGDQVGLLPHVLALVGMGALFAGVIRAPVTSILIIFELTRDYNLILPIMLANLISFGIASKLRHVPIYEALLMQDGVNLRKFPILRPSQGWQSMPVSSIMTNTVHTLQADMPLGVAYKKIKDEGFKVYPVVDKEMHYIGLVHRKGVLVVSQNAPLKQVQDIFISETFPKVFPDTKIKDAAKEFVNTEWIALPVVSRLDDGRVIGVVTLHDITRQQFLQETKGD